MEKVALFNARTVEMREAIANGALVSDYRKRFSPVAFQALFDEALKHPETGVPPALAYLDQCSLYLSAVLRASYR